MNAPQLRLVHFRHGWNTIGSSDKVYLSVVLYSHSSDVIGSTGGPCFLAFNVWGRRAQVEQRLLSISDCAGRLLDLAVDLKSKVRWFYDADCSLSIAALEPDMTLEAKQSRGYSLHSTWAAGAAVEARVLSYVDTVNPFHSSAELEDFIRHEHHMKLLGYGKPTHIAEPLKPVEPPKPILTLKDNPRVRRRVIE